MRSGWLSLDVNLFYSPLDWQVTENSFRTGSSEVSENKNSENRQRDREPGLVSRIDFSSY